MFGALEAADPAAAPPELETPPPALPAHAPLTDGRHVNPSPQSASTLHGSSDLYAQNEIDFAEHGVDVVGGQIVPAAHAPDVPPHVSVDV
jgi:hypothetical protein